eukprot:Anaeramoba_ignava/c20775_g2_i3.p1 GENE.c20775_g2_i3~~c20775_g2_i3.p1  ORF type:complete len:1518 (+),score=432.92 c20775_g2_i3:43-4596(+)
MGNTFTSSLPFEIGETQYQLENWVLHEGKRKSDNSKVSIFLRKIEQTTQRTAIYLATNGYHNIRITHHPDFLQYLEGDENEQMIYYITEPAIPLNQVLNNLTFDEKIWGIYKLATALEFLNSSCKIIHGSLDSSNIFVTEGGDWKLGTLDHSIKFDELSQQDLANKLNRLKYQPPEIESRAINQIKQSPIHAIDSYCLGCFLTEILSTVQFGGKNNNIFYSAHQIKKLFKGSQIENIDELIKIISGLTASNPTDRISPETAIKSDFFQNNSYFISLNFLESIALKSEHERESFFKKIPTLISKIPEKVSKQKLLPILLEQLKLTNNVKVLRPVLIITSLLTQEEYTTMIAPVILKLFSSMNRSIRIGLLENLPDYIKFLSKQDINGVIFNNIINGFTDSAPLLRELTLKCMVHFAPSLNEQNLDNKAVRLISKLQMDPEPGIRTNSIICLGKIAQYLKQSTKEQILIPVFLRSLKDPFSPSRINSLKALLATKDSYSFSSSARKLLPSVCVVLADPDFEVRKMGAVVVKAFVEMLEQESVKIHEKELSQPENSENKSSLMGWVQQKLRRGEETKNSPNPNLNQNTNFNLNQFGNQNFSPNKFDFGNSPTIRKNTQQNPYDFQNTQSPNIKTNYETQFTTPTKTTENMRMNSIDQLLQGNYGQTSPNPSNITTQTGGIDGNFDNLLKSLGISQISRPNQTTTNFQPNSFSNLTPRQSSFTTGLSSPVQPPRTVSTGLTNVDELIKSLSQNTPTQNFSRNPSFLSGIQTPNSELKTSGFISQRQEVNNEIESADDFLNKLKSAKNPQFSPQILDQKNEQENTQNTDKDSNFEHMWENGTTYDVDCNGIHSKYSKISDIYEQMSSGDTIRVFPGIYHESMEIKKGIRIIGFGQKNQVVFENPEAEYDKPIFQFHSSFGSLKNIYIKYSGIDTGIKLFTGTVTIEGCTISSQGVSGITAESGAQPQIKDCVISGCKQVGVLILSNSTAGKLENNTFSDNLISDIEIKTEASPTIIGNILRSGITVHDHATGRIENNKFLKCPKNGLTVMNFASPNVVNNVVQECGYFGVFICQRAKGVFEKNTVIGNQKANFGISSEADPVIRDNQILQSAGFGIWCFETAMGEIESNEIRGNGEAGILISTGSDPKILRNLISEQKKNGVFIFQNCQGRLERNKIFQNNGHGVEIKKAASPTLDFNEIYKNKGAGVLVSEYSKPTITNNEIFMNYKPNLVVTSHSEPSVERNHIYDGFQSGILVIDSKGVFSSNELDGNQFSGAEIKSKSEPIFKQNKFHDCQAYGIWINEESTGVFQENEFTNNKNYSIFITNSSNPQILSNTITKGEKSGICVQGPSAGVFSKNNISAHQQPEVVLKNGATSVFFDNKIHHSKQSGFFITDQSHCTITENQIFNNTLSGIEINMMSFPVIEKNKIFDGQSSGILIHQKAGGTIKENEIYCNCGPAITIGESAAPNIVQNWIHDGQSCGIKAMKAAKGNVTLNKIVRNNGGALTVLPNCFTKFVKNELA